MSRQFVKQLERDNCTHFSQHAYPCVQFNKVHPDLVHVYVVVYDFSYMGRKKEMARIKPIYQSCCSISCRFDVK